jgi:pimeloyl-ACP methyl ester carboxylesterase
MKTQTITTAVLFLVGILFGAYMKAQEITGEWYGNPIYMGMKLPPLVFHIEKTADGYTSTMDSPEQGVKGIRVTSTVFDGVKLSMEIASLNMTCEGELKADSIVGTVKQNGMMLTMALTKTPAKINLPSRPQEPKPPFPYRSENVTFENTSAGIALAGTLTMPQAGNNFTAVILVSGSGAQNRDEELMNHKPFLVIADYLTRKGIAVLRYDDRGTAQSTGDFKTATIADFATDAASAVAYLKTRNEINPNKIGLAGHSEGGIVAPIVATQSNDVAFIVMMAGTGLRGDKMMLLQIEAVSRVLGVPESNIAADLKIRTKLYDLIVSAKEDVSAKELTDFMNGIKDEIEAFIPEGGSADDYIEPMAAAHSSAYFNHLLRYDPAPILEKVQCPVLAINGSKDVQVIASENLTAIEAALKRGGNLNATIKEYPNLNHLFQECNTGSHTEYQFIEQTISPDVLKDLGEWVLKLK